MLIKWGSSNFVRTPLVWLGDEAEIEIDLVNECSKGGTEEKLTTASYVVYFGFISFPLSVINAPKFPIVSLSDLKTDVKTVSDNKSPYTNQ